MSNLSWEGISDATQRKAHELASFLDGHAFRTASEKWFSEAWKRISARQLRQAAISLGWNENGCDMWLRKKNCFAISPRYSDESCGWSDYTTLIKAEGVAAVHEAVVRFGGRP